MEKRVIFALAVTLGLFVFVNFVFVNFFGFFFSPTLITGHAVEDSGLVNIFIDDLHEVYIHSPENITYNFNKGDLYILELNVSSNFLPDEWMYSIYDMAHGRYSERDVEFTPNSSNSITAVRWGNILTVSARESAGEWASSQVIFYVNVSNSDPIIGNISEPILLCEGEVARFRFNATDIDEDDLTGDISPKNPFYLDFIIKVVDVSYFDIISGILRKDDVGSYVETLSVMDPWEGIDMRDVDIEVIEINNRPVLENLGAQTVWLTGENSTFNHEYLVYDVEDEESSDGNMMFNLTWEGGENLFDIDSSYGIMNYTPSPGEEGVYNLTICVEDNPLGSAHPNISVCAPSVATENIVCDDFSLTVTNENRAPRILSYLPLEAIFDFPGMQYMTYNVTVDDPDGTIPDIDWYVDGVLMEHNEAVYNDSFTYRFACGYTGVHTVEIVTTDGLLNDSFEWIIDVENHPCPVQPQSSNSGGGGGAQVDYCKENWVCDDWDVCQNVKRSFDSGILSLEDYAVAKDACLQNKEEDPRFCGFQVTKCYDLNACNESKTNADLSVLDRLREKRFCYFTENPSCSDGITNCHDGACEVLVDCGGPCGACATCTDGVQNQGEDGVDCGGPCPYLCEPEVPFAMISSVLMVAAIFLVILILLILWRILLLWVRRGEKEEGEVSVKFKDKVSEVKNEEA